MTIKKSLKFIQFTLLSFSLLVAFSLQLAAQEKALVGGRLIDGFGHQPLANSVILIKDGWIVTTGYAKVSPNDAVI